jgi:hypothetical protein
VNYFPRSESQFTMTVNGMYAAFAAGTDIRKRPSGATSYCRSLVGERRFTVSGVWKRTIGRPAVKAGPVLTGTDIIFPSRDR